MPDRKKSKPSKKRKTRQKSKRSEFDPEEFVEDFKETIIQDLTLNSLEIRKEDLSFVFDEIKDLGMIGVFVCLEWKLDSGFIWEWGCFFFFL